MNQNLEEKRVALPGADKGGAWVQMGDKAYKVAPLNFKALRELAGNISALQGIEKGQMPNAEQMGILVKLAHASIQRNYPDITEEQVAEDLDFGNFTSVLNAVMGASDLLGREVPNKGETSPS